MEAQKNIERRKNNLEKLNGKLQTLVKGGVQNESKLERLEEEFTSINRSYDSPFHQFKHCTIGLNPQSKLIIMFLNYISCKLNVRKYWKLEVSNGLIFQ